MAKKREENIISDDDVIRSVKSGRISDFEILIDRYKVRIVNFIYRMILDYDEAQSISQDVFFKIFTNIKKFREEDNFNSFIFTIAKNMTLNYIKKSKRSIRLSTLFKRTNDNSLASSDESGDAKVEKEEKEKLLDLGLKSINEDQRLALIMKIYLRLSYKDICDITGWSEPKVETLIFRAKKNLINFVKMQENG